MTAIRPCGHHLVIKPIELPKESKGGILLNFEGSQYEKLERASRMIGVIMAIGPQCWKAHAAALGERYELWADLNDTVLYSRHAGKFVFDPMDGAELYVIHDEDVLAVLPPQKDWTADLLSLV